MGNTTPPLSAADAERILEAALMARRRYVPDVAADLEQLVAEKRPAEELGRHYLRVASDFAQTDRREEANEMIEMADMQMTLLPTGRIEVLVATGHAAWQMGKPVQALRALMGADKLIRDAQEAVDADILNGHARLMRILLRDGDPASLFAKALKGLPKEFS